MLPEGTPGNMYLGAKVSICRSSAPNVGTRCFARLLSPHVECAGNMTVFNDPVVIQIRYDSFTSVADFTFVSLCLELWTRLDSQHVLLRTNQWQNMRPAIFVAIHFSYKSR